ncbi:hypothetical protein [Tritonibacter horizontis]|nr:hypothetical protein [Tritonibacter horizontis]
MTMVEAIVVTAATLVIVLGLQAGLGARDRRAMTEQAGRARRWFS